MYEKQVKNQLILLGSNLSRKAMQLLPLILMGLKKSKSQIPTADFYNYEIVLFQFLIRQQTSDKTTLSRKVNPLLMIV
ncbi:hypothetical protein RINTHM_16910 [Richelia intracellularis HM01]|nr:hypothetical protein RINTHM_16910 [Richelia intracellularis HM01]